MGQESLPRGWLTDVENLMMDPKLEKVTFCSKSSAFGPGYGGEQRGEQVGVAFSSCCCSSFGNVTNSWDKGGREMDGAPVWKVLLADVEQKLEAPFPLPVFLPLYPVP